MEKTNILQVNKELCGQRLDNFLIKRLKGLPKSLIYKLIRSGQVRVNKKRSKVSYRIADNDLIRIPPYLIHDQLISQKIMSNSSDYIHFENEDFIIIDKPYGIAVHGGTNQEVDFLSSLKNSLGNINLSLVHRLDKNTSGCMLVSKNYQSASFLGKELMNRNIQKKYYALLLGRMSKSIVEIESKIEKDNKSQKMTINFEDGREAYTKINLLKQYKTHCLVDIEIETGRTHQIRLHAASIGHPVAGDNKYNKDNKQSDLDIGLKRLFLHSYYLSFYYNKKYEFILDLPSELKEVLSMLEEEND
jgi:23S rRNA pseudouridine955/2504/2580 synthase